MQGYLGSQSQLERGALRSVIISGGLKMKLYTIWFCGNQSMRIVRGQARTFVNLPEAVPRDCLPAAIDDRVDWRKRAMGG